MVKIECNVYEKYDFLKTIDYAKEKKIEDCNKGKITPKLLDIELEKLNRLKQRVNGIVKEDYQEISAAYRRENETVKKEDKRVDYYKD